MENTLRAPVAKSYSGQQVLLLSIVALLGLWYYQTYSQVQHTQRDRVQMEKSSGKNGKHANADARKSAEEQFEKVKQEYDQLFSKTKKSNKDIQTLDKMKKQVEHWRKKKTGQENNIHKNTKANDCGHLYFYCQSQRRHLRSPSGRTEYRASLSYLGRRNH